MADEFDAELDRVRRAYEMRHEKTNEMITDHLAAGAVIVSQQAAALAAGVLSRPDFFREATN